MLNNVKPRCLAYLREGSKTLRSKLEKQVFYPDYVTHCNIYRVSQFVIPGS
jgi:hypothetical protein